MTKYLYAGLTYNGHALACAAALATIEVYEEDKIYRERQRRSENISGERLEDIKARHRLGGRCPLYRLVLGARTGARPRDQGNHAAGVMTPGRASSCVANGVFTFIIAKNMGSMFRRPAAVHHQGATR
ncbi:MAG: hypothetical protein MZV70_21520 [Desulfobacterales bacterium]|nr:hypothetical protein [Desulfobacterales bacterium]